MGLKETVQAGVRKGFASLGNLGEAVTYLATDASGVYDPDANTLTRKETATALSGIFLQYSKQEIDGQQIKPHDEQFLFLQSSLATRPTLQDRIRTIGGTYWEVVSVRQDPAQATWSLQVRGTNG